MENASAEGDLSTQAHDNTQLPGAVTRFIQDTGQSRRGAEQDS